MATYASEFTSEGALSTAKETHRLSKRSTPIGDTLIKYTTVIDAEAYDVQNDKIELAVLPPAFRLFGASVVSDKEFDVGGSALRLGLVLDDGTSASTFTSGNGTAFANQPQNDAVSVLSSSAGDTTQTVTVYGTTTATDTVVVEVLALNGTTVVDSVKLDWGFMLGASLSAVTVGNITLEEASGNADIIVFTAGETSKGITAVTAGQTSFYDRLVRLVGSGSGTKTVGLVGTDSDDNVIYDAQALTGTTSVWSNSRFKTVTSVLIGDLESNRTLTITGVDRSLVTGSTALSSAALPINFVGGTNPDTEYGCEAGGDKISLIIETAPSTANTGDITFTTLVHGWVGVVGDMGTSQA